MTSAGVRLDPKRRGAEAEQLYQQLGRIVVGQEEAIREIVDVYQLYSTGLSAPGRPIGNFLFLGPTGCGKTRLVEATAECLLNDPKAVIKIDCAEFQHSHEIAKLIGSPPGYLGHRETHALLSQEAIDRYCTETVKMNFVLFDEIEKASDALWNLLLGIMDKAVLTLGDNRKVDFSRSLIFLTGNLGAAEMNSVLQPRMGFESVAAMRSGINAGEVDEQVAGKMSRSATEAARRKFTPEFLNRLDKIVVFKPLEKNELRCIVDLELKTIQERIANRASAFEFKVTEAGKDFLLAEGTDIRYGARHLKRTIDRLVVQPLARLIASRQVKNGDVVAVDHPAGAPAMTFARINERLAQRAEAA